MENSPVVMIIWQIATIEAVLAKQQFIEKEAVFIGLCKMLDALKKKEFRQIEELRAELEPIEDIFNELSIDRKRLYRRLRAVVGQGDYEQTDKVIHRSEECKELFAKAEEIAKKYNYPTLQAIHLWLSIIEATHPLPPLERGFKRGFISQVISEAGAGVETIKKAIVSRLRKMIKVIIVRGNDKGIWELNKKEININRGEPADINLSLDNKVSRNKHARITYEAGKYWLEDLNSKTGTFIEEKRITEKVELAVNVEFRVGKTILKLLPTCQESTEELLPPTDEESKEIPIKEPELRTAHILFMDIVGFSKLKSDQQVKTKADLNQIVKDSLHNERLLRLDTGDGMALAFLDNPEAPLEVARKIAPKVKEAGIPLRMGMHTGNVYLVEDINQQENIVGGGINLAQRVMNCGDAGHILASNVFAEALSEVKEEYERLFHYLGRFEVKHGVEIKVYNVYEEGVGNPNPLQKTIKHTTGVVSSKDFKFMQLPPSLHNQTPPEPNFVGRDELLKTITEWYQSPAVHIGALIGWGGVGKSALARKWYESLAENNIQPDGIFWWRFYRNSYLDLFLNELLRYVSQGEIDPEGIKGSWDKVERIKGYLHHRAYLLILDGLEEMQKPESGDGFGKMMHRELTELLHYLADTSRLGLCLITTRFPLKDLEKWHNHGYKSLELTDLSVPDALAMLRKRGVKGENSAIKEVVERYKGHALSLTLLAGFLNKYYDGDISKSPEVKFVLSDEKRFEDVNKLLHKYAEKISEAELCFLKIFSLFRREITEQEFIGVFRMECGGLPPLSKMKFNEPLVRINELDFKDLVAGLVDWRLISEGEREKRGSKGEEKVYTTHPLIKGYFEFILEEKQKIAVHKAIYEYFGRLALEEPKTLEEMQPLFEQVYHGCRARLYDEVFYEVYWGKIHKREEYFITSKLGAWEIDLFLAKNFFPEADLSQMSLVIEKNGQAFLLHAAGGALLNTGRPKDAEKPFLTGIKMYIDAEDWENANRGYLNLTDLQFRTGELEKGLLSAKEALKLSEKAESDEGICTSKAYLAWILHLLGKTEESGRYFREADELERKLSGYRFYSLGGAFYADFLLSIKQIDEALRLTETNLEICKEQENDWLADIPRCHRLLSAIQRIKGNHKSAESHLKTSLELARKVGMPVLEIEALLESGRLHLDMGKQEEAIQSCQSVLNLCSRTGFKLHEPEAELILAKAYLALKDLAKARPFAQSAYDKADEMHYHWPKLESGQLLEKIGKDFYHEISTGCYGMQNQRQRHTIYSG